MVCVRPQYNRHNRKVSDKQENYWVFEKIENQGLENGSGKVFSGRYNFWVANKRTIVNTKSASTGTGQNATIYRDKLALS